MLRVSASNTPEVTVSDDPQAPLPAVTRRRVLTWLGAAGAAAVAAGCSNGTSSRSGAPGTTGASGTSPSSTASPSSTSASAAGASCVLTPEQTEGPYYLDGEAVRSDITDGRPGVPLRLDLTVVDAGGCRPIPGATVDVWHADAGGNYSGFGSTTANRTFLRGVQTADAVGKVVFRTIYPGWYQGRTTHIHVKVHVGGSEVHTGQLYFDETVTDAVYARPPYDSRSGPRTTNAQDGIYGNGGARSTLRITPDGDGYVGALTLGVAGGSAASSA